MAEDRAAGTGVQQPKRRRFGIVLALVILLASPFLVVGGFDLTTRTQFAAMEAQSGGVRNPIGRYDAFQHGYASGVMAVLFGDLAANAAGQVVELVEQNRCRERESDLINNQEGRRLALAIHDAQPDGWRRRFAAELFADLRRVSTAFSTSALTDHRTAAACASG